MIIIDTLRRFRLELHPGSGVYVRIPWLGAGYLSWSAVPSEWNRWRTLRALGEV